MSRYKFEDIKELIKRGDRVEIRHSVLKNIEHITTGIIRDISNKKLVSGLVKIQIGADEKHLREIPIIYINKVNKCVDNVGKNVNCNNCKYYKQEKCIKGCKYKLEHFKKNGEVECKKFKELG